MDNPLKNKQPSILVQGTVRCKPTNDLSHKKPRHFAFFQSFFRQVKEWKNRKKSPDAQGVGDFTKLFIKRNSLSVNIFRSIPPVLTWPLFRHLPSSITPKI
ncbi:MAG: hypothetical protein PUH24_08435 [Prevotellaceae bacterium]|nr:hypothetical protein [Prevotella sp.]MDD7258275.1 hypothetical protein [Prevotellaceae bacterium]MDY6130980.1 hypothetical protein [Prevotella sp.]